MKNNNLISSSSSSSSSPLSHRFIETIRFSIADRGSIYIVTLSEEERIAWMWCIIIAFAVPEFGTMVRSIRMCIFKSWKKPQSTHFLLVLIMETFHVMGLALMFLAVLPELDVVKGAMLTNCVCFVPGLLGNLSE